MKLLRYEIAQASYKPCLWIERENFGWIGIPQVAVKLAALSAY